MAENRYSYKIAHLADIHIQDRRRDEYAAVFEKLYEKLRGENDSKGPDVIVVAGDIFDNKMRASAHNLEDVAKFLSTLADIAPVILTAGNHDTNCLTPGSLDLLSPLITEHSRLQPPRLIYQRNSGRFTAHGIDWVVKATDGDMPAELILATLDNDTQVSKNPSILLFHEEVNGALLPNGTILENYKLNVNDFAKFTAVMGGHIHKRQMIAPNAAYCGSLVQQNIGEGHVGHGYLLWTINDTHISANGVDIYNPQGYLRVEIDAQGNDNTAHPLPVNPHYWEVMYDYEARPEVVALRDSIVKSYRERYADKCMAPRAVRLRNGLGPAEQKSGDEKTNQLGDAQEDAKSLSTQNDIIREILGDAHPHLADVIEMHKNRAPPPPASERARIRFKRLEFDNMYSYKEGNVVDFTKLENCVSGIIAPNHAGKSSLIEALAFALYDTHPRAGLKSSIVHSGATHCKVSLDFEIDGKPGRIEKWVASGRDTRAHHNTNPYRLWFNGEELTQGGTPGTLTEAAKLLGTVKNSLVSSFSLQNGEGNFINSSCIERKQLLASALSLGSFESLERSTAKEMVSLNGAVKALEKQFNGVALESLEASLAKAKNDVELYTSKMKDTVYLANTPTSFVFNQAVELLKAQERLSAVNATLKNLQDGQNNNMDKVLQTTKEKLEKYKAVQLPERPKLVNWNRERNGPRNPNPPELAKKILANSKFTPEECDKMVNNKQKDIAVLRVELQNSREIANTLAITRASTLAVADRQVIFNSEEISNIKNIKESAARTVIQAESSLATMNSFTDIVDKTKLSPDCAGCNSVLKICSEEDKKEAINKLNKLKMEASDASANYKAAIGHNLRINILSLTKAEENLATFQEAIRWLEVASYWSIRDTEEWIRKRDDNARLIDDTEKEYTQLTSNLESFKKKFAAEYETLSTEKEMLVTTIESLEEKKKIEQTAFYESLACSAESDFNKAMSERNAVIQQFAVARESVASLTVSYNNEKLRSSALSEATKSSEVLYAYRSVIKASGGIADKLLEKSRAGLTLKINAALLELGARFEVDIEPSFEVLHRRVDHPSRTDNDCTWISVSLASGYQRFILSLATRLAIWRLATATLPDALIIDEGFGACDDDYLATLGEALEALADAPDSPRLIFIVSHVDVLKARLERALTISVTPEGSLVTNTINNNIINNYKYDNMPEKKKKRRVPAAPTVAATEGTVEVPIVATTEATTETTTEATTEVSVEATIEATVEATTVESTTDNKKWECLICQKSYATTYKYKHLTSAVHLKAEKKMTQ